MQICDSVTVPVSCDTMDTASSNILLRGLKAPSSRVTSLTSMTTELLPKMTPFLSYALQSFQIWLLLLEAVLSLVSWLKWMRGDFLIVW